MQEFRRKRLSGQAARNCACPVDFPGGCPGTSNSRSRSGAHISPSVSLAFFARGKMYAEDLTGYLSGQFLGGLGGAWLLIMVWGARAANIHNGITAPGPGYSIWFVFLAEFGMTLVNWFWTSQWLYWVALPIGGLTAALLFHFLRRNRRLPTAKLFHTPNYRCIFKNVHVPHIPVNR